MFERRKVIRPPLNDLLIDIKNLGYRGTGNKYGVSDNSIRKWVKLYKKDINIQIMRYIKNFNESVINNSIIKILNRLEPYLNSCLFGYTWIKNSSCYL